MEFGNSPGNNSYNFLAKLNSKSSMAILSRITLPKASADCIPLVTISREPHLQGQQDYFHP